MVQWAEIVRIIASWSVYLIYLAVIISTIWVVVLENRNPVKTIAWVLVLVFMPVVGLFFYIFFGRTQRRDQIISKRTYNKLLKHPETEYLSQIDMALPADYQGLISLFQNTNHAFPYSHNYTKIFTTGADWIKALLSELQLAEDHIHLQSYIFADDEVGRQVRDVLVQKARQGVTIRVIYDDVGSWQTPNTFFDTMMGAGIEVRSFLKVRFPLFTNKANYRNHRKLVVIDGRTGFIGGMNLADRYVKGVSWGIWRDTHMIIKGKAVHGLQTAFLLDWYFTDRTLYTSARYYPEIGNMGPSMIQVVTSSPVQPGQEIVKGLVKAISNAKHYFYIQTPYFLPTESMLNALQTAALSGVDIRLMIPEKSDTKMTYWGSRSYVSDMLKFGVKVYFYQKGFLHSKLMVSDDRLTTIGSTNMDFRSFEHNFEANAFIYDQQVAEEARSIFLADQRDCVQISLKQWEKRHRRSKIIESLVRLMSPLL
ncbi:MAG: cardiolipin synthase [Bacteroidaceae bacterium]|nr:cardiolipin synthase [Bacteroidaceae bacterium]